MLPIPRFRDFHFFPRSSTFFHLSTFRTPHSALQHWRLAIRLWLLRVGPPPNQGEIKPNQGKSNHFKLNQSNLSSLLPGIGPTSSSGGKKFPRRKSKIENHWPRVNALNRG